MWLPFFLVILGGAYATIPRGFCSVKSQNFNQCIKEFVQKYIPTVTLDGIPELGLERLDPFEVFGLTFNFDSDLIKGTLEVRRALLKGLNHAKLTDINVNLDDPNHVVIKGEGMVPKLLLEGEYKASCRLPGMEVKGEGSFKILLEQVSGTGQAVAEILPIDGKKYLNVKDVDVLPKINNMKIKVDGLMPGDPKLADTAVRMLNEMWKDYYNEMLPIFKPKLNEIIKSRANIFASKIPIDNFIYDY